MNDCERGKSIGFLVVNGDLVGMNASQSFYPEKSWPY
ncbi:hypothetical protein MFUM_230033 [Methylacidiphilum fumariolicum SolV]|uniref:Uncharacterized protein n=1 Tax=Methylacidiphilum fumariolicum (strain SolV) TaxID=1156937 RepID=I0JX85_METFB|nr:hypothetical protein MFUM_230033 [Methylacidiphilum fumariolicum SolV]